MEIINEIAIDQLFIKRKRVERLSPRNSSGITSIVIKIDVFLLGTGEIIIQKNNDIKIIPFNKCEFNYPNPNGEFWAYLYVNDDGNLLRLHRI